MSKEENIKHIYYDMGGMLAMAMTLVYNLADTFFIGQTGNDYMAAGVSLATPVFLFFMAIGTVFGIGGTSVISRAEGAGKHEYARKACLRHGRYTKATVVDHIVPHRGELKLLRQKKTMRNAAQRFSRGRQGAGSSRC